MNIPVISPIGLGCIKSIQIMASTWYQAPEIVDESYYLQAVMESGKPTKVELSGGKWMPVKGNQKGRRLVS